MRAKTLFGLMLAACACSVHGVTNVVHDAARDLVLNTANRTVLMTCKTCKKYKHP